MAVIYLDADECPLCKSRNIRFNSKTNEFYCKDCGYVLQDMVFNIERKYHQEARKVYVNPRKKKIAVIIGSMLKTNLERKMAPFERELKRLQLTPFLERDILHICRRAVEKKLTLGNTRNTLLAAAVYAVAKRSSIPIMISDLERVFDVKRIKVLRTYKKLCRELKIDQLPQSYDTLILRMADRLGVEGNVSTLAIRIAKDYQSVVRSPVSLAAVSLYAACGVFRSPIRQADCANAANITVVTLERNWKKLFNNGFDIMKYKKMADHLA